MFNNRAIGINKRYEGVYAYGLGYVGSTLCSVWLRDEHQVLGLDIAEKKVKALNDGSIFHVEPKASREIVEQFLEGLLRQL